MLARENLKPKQAMKVKFNEGIKDVPITDVTADNYIVPDKEQGDYHVVLEVRQFDPKTGKRLSKPRIQKFDPKTWNTVGRVLRQQGYDITILHDPTEWNKKHAAEREAMAKKAEEQRKAAERAAMKAAIIAELKAEGLIKTTTKKSIKG